MSGFEIAGVVLGSFPLLISACEHYKEGFAPLIKWKRFRSDFIGFIDAVDAERLLFDQMLERFLLSTDAVDHDELQCFKTDATYEGWKRKDLVDILGRRLGPSLPVFMSSMKAINALILELQDILLLKNGEVDWAAEGASRWDYQLKRIHLSFSKKGTKTVGALETHNRKLRELLDSNEKLEAIKTNHKDTSWANVFESIRRHANSIHAAIKNGFSCSCPPHWTALRLEPRKEGYWSSDFYLDFNMPKIGPSTNLLRREVVMKLRKSETTKDMTLASPPQRMVGQTSLESNLTVLRYNFESKSTSTLDLQQQRPALSNTKSGSNLGGARIKFKERFAKGILNTTPNDLKSSHEISAAVQDDQTKTLSVPKKAKKQVKVAESCTTVGSQPISMVTVRTKNDCPEIVNLYSAMTSSKDISGIFGYLCDGQREHELRHLRASEITTEDPYVSLDTILSGASDVKLTRQQRYTLASILASSILQLQTTPWLAENMNKKTIFFFRQDKNVLIDYPYIKHAFDSAQSRSQVSAEPSTSDRFAVRNSLSNLGILLLELCFGQPIESQELRRPYLGPNGESLEYTNYLTARDWAELVSQEEPAFEQIIKCCVFCSFSEKADWENKRFTQAVHGSVVAPLEKLHKKWSTVRTVPRRHPQLLQGQF